MGVYAQIQEMDAVGRPLPADFENLAAAICYLPATADPQEQKQRLATVNWLLRSRVPFHTRTAVKELKKLHMAE